MTLVDDWGPVLGRTVADAPGLAELAAVGEAEPVWYDDDGYVESPDQGVSLVLDRATTVVAVQLHGAGHEDFAGYAGPLLDGLTFDSGRAAARLLLGPPTSSGEATTSAFLGPKPPWDAFEVGGLRVHLEYRADGAGIGMVSVTPADWQP